MNRIIDYRITTGRVSEEVVHARRKRRDHAEAVARKVSLKYPEPVRIWEQTERDSPIGRIRSASCVATYEAGEAK